LIDCYKGKAFLVLDRINPLKKFVKKYSPIHANHERTPIVELPKLVLAIKTLLGASTVVANTFSINPQTQSYLNYRCSFVVCMDW